ncbi:MAG: S8 family serine peptidase, partial [Phycisphaerae bacterium]|nr:S8 family serine peptidase [Phycisphaerae bacterium]
YLDWAVINNGYEATESAFWTYLYVDGSLEAAWSTASPLSAGSYDEVGDYDLGSLGVGSHTIEIVADATGTVDESSEGDNTYTKNIVIGAFGEIHGSAWNDLDGDGIRDGGEPALADWKIYLDDNLNAQWDDGELFEMTDSSGNYSFLELPADKYIVAEELQEGWAQTSPSVGGTSTSAPAEGYAEGYAGGITTTGSTAEAHAFGEVVAAGGIVTPQSNVSGPLINIDTFRSDPRFAGMDGSGFAAVILDTGIDVDHPFFGPDSDSDGIADRIVYQWDYAYGDADASDVDGHGSNVSSIVASEDATYTGMAPSADIIHLKVLDDDGSGTFAWVESALQWVAANAAAYNIASVNMSLGDGSNFGSPISLYGIGDEMAALAALDVIVVSAAGNSFYEHGSVPGIGYPAADANSLAIGAVYDSNAGGFTYGDGSQAFSTGADRITVFSQRHETMTSVFAPGAPITGAGATGGLLTYHGTSQASPHIAGIA